METKQQYVATNVKLSFKERLDYAVSEFGYNAIYVWVSSFMLIFYTDQIGVAAASVSLLTLVVRIFDALNDPLIGSIADRSHSRWGKYKPWVGIGATVMSILIVVLFSAQPTWSYTTKVVYMWVVYIAVTVASTCCNMPFGALNGVITSDGTERAKLSSLRMVFANIGSNFTGLVAIPLILFFSGTGGTTQTAKGYTFAVLVCVILGLPTLIWSSVKVKERVQPPPDQKKIPLGKQFSAFFKNRYAVLIALSFFMIGFFAYGRMAVLAYYFTYYAEAPGLYSITGVCGIVASIVGSGFIGPFIYKKLMHKGRTMVIAHLISAVCWIPLAFVRPTNFVFWVFYLVASLGSSAGIAMAYGIVGDAVDFGELKTGVRVDGFVASFVSLMMKAGGAVGPALLLALIDMLGYVPNQAQNSGVLTALNFSVSWLPCIMCLLIVVINIFYNMDAKKHEEIRKELDRRRGITE